MAPWVSPVVPEITPFPGTGGLSASACGACHPEVYAEWQASTHAHAWTDPQFQAELHKDPGVGWVCINCHTPLAAQQAQIITDKATLREPAAVDNPAFDPDLQAEGITCLTCHWRPAGIAAVHQDVDAPHPVVYDPGLRDAATCTGCHQAMARVEEMLVCHFNTGEEWAAADPGRACPACHMPRVNRSHAVGAPVREGGRHLWPGSLLPKVPQSAAQGAMFGDWVPGSTAALGMPDVAAVGATVTVTGRVENAHAGHMLPTGDPERHLLLTLVATDRSGALLAREVHRVGQVWIWWPEARKLGDTRLEPGETAALTLDFAQPEGGADVVLTVEHVRISDENADFHQLWDYPRRRVVHRVSRSVEVERPR